MKDAIGGAIQARFVVLADGAAAWPCEMSSAKAVRLVVPEPIPDKGTGGERSKGGGTTIVSEPSPNKRVGKADLEPSEVQDLADVIPQLLELKNKYGTPIQFSIRIECGDGTNLPKDAVVDEINKILLQIKKGLKID